MDGFLKAAAQHIVHTRGGKINELNIVFVSRRAQIYFENELASINSSYKPTYFTIDKFISEMRPNIVAADKITLITELYNIYKEFVATESFDKFYSFAQLLISDFDTVDRYMVPAQQLYSNISDIKDLDDFADDNAHSAAVNFWRTFQKSKSQDHEQKQFLKIWQSLYQIYSKYKQQLASMGIAYQGMIYRQVAENVPQNATGSYIFVGLNALSTSEQRILKTIQKQADTSFYWDYSQSWIESPDTEAGYFIRQNLQQFPQAPNFDYAEQNKSDIELKVIDTPSEILQCKIVGQELLRIKEAQNGVIGAETAVILTDENLLQPLLYSIPDSITSFNISMGYPLSSTFAYQFLECLIALDKSSRISGGQIEFYHADIERILLHPYIAQDEIARKIRTSAAFYITSNDLAEIAPLQATLWRKSGTLFGYLCAGIEHLNASSDDGKDEGDIGNETINGNEKMLLGTLLGHLKSFTATIAKCKIDISKPLYITLLKEYLTAQTIDFEGFSGQGVQILGILESRSLDFKNIIILSLSDDNFPSARPAASYIPITLREGFSMPSLAEHSAIWSFYFFRLLQRAQSMTMLYCSSADNNTSGEASRYILQLKYCSNHKIEFESVVMDTVKSAIPTKIEVAKTAEMTTSLLFRKYSPTAICRYIDCPIKFYFNDVAEIKPPQEQDETISALDLGNALHKVMEGLNTATKIDKSLIESTINDYLRQVLSYKIDLNQGSALILKTTLQRMVENIVDYDANYSEFATIYKEQSIEASVGKYHLKGTVDRIDKLHDGGLRVVDYKSGADKPKIKSIDALFAPDPQGHNAAALQTLIYCYAVAQNYNENVTPALYTARKMGADGFSPLLHIGSAPIEQITSEINTQIETNTAAVIERICDPETPFTQTEYPKEKCTYCVYNAICRR